MAEPSGREAHWIQKPTTKRLWCPHLLLEPSQTFICKPKQSQLGRWLDDETEGWTKKTTTLWSLHPMFSPHIFLFSSHSSSQRHVPPPSHRCIDLFRLQENFQTPRLALQLYRDITERMNVLKIWEEGMFGAYATTFNGLESIKQC